MSDEAVYRTAPATPGLLDIVQCQKMFFSMSVIYLHFSHCEFSHFFCELIDLGSILSLQRVPIKSKNQKEL